MRDRNIQTIVTDWSGVKIRISYEAKHCTMESLRIAHLQIRVMEPEFAPLPITETGYRPHFIHPNDVEVYGGPLPYVLAWLDAEARSPQWKAAEASRRQLSLFF